MIFIAFDKLIKPKASIFIYKIILFMFKFGFLSINHFKLTIYKVIKVSNLNIEK